MLRQYRRELAGFVRLQIDLAHTPTEAVRAFCATEREVVALALQCRRSIATRQRDDVCEIADGLSQNTRRYYYLQLDCQLHSEWLHVPLPKLKRVIFS